MCLQNGEPTDFRSPNFSPTLRCQLFGLASTAQKCHFSLQFIQQVEYGILVTHPLASCVKNPANNRSEAAAMAISRLAAIVESSDDAIIGKDLNGIITSWNQGAEKIFGYTAEEMVGSSILRLFPPERQREENFILEKIKRGEKVEHFETLRQTKDGRLIDISVSISPIKDTTGNIVGASKIARDITMRKAHEQEVLRLSRLYAALSQINQAIVWTRDRDELFEKICRALVELGKFSMAWIGLTDAETRQVNPIARWGDQCDYLSQVTIYLDERSEDQGPVSSAIREGKSYISNDFSRDRNTVPWLEPAKRVGFQAMAAFPIREAGTVCGAIMVYSNEIGFFKEQEIALLEEAASDVSFALEYLTQDEKRRQVEASLRESEERYKALFDRSLDCVFLNDFDGKFLDANQAALDLLGYQREDLATLTFASLLTEDQLPLAFQLTEEIRTTGRQRHPVEFRLRGKDGRQVEVETRSSLIYREGNPFAILGIARDLTERRKAEQELRENEEKFSKIFQCSPMGMSLSTIEDGCFLDANQAFLNLLQRSRDEVIGHTVAELDIWGSTEKRAAMLAELNAHGTVHNIDLNIRGRLGQTSTILWSAEKVLIAGRNCLLGLSLDITRRKQAEVERDRLFNLSLDMLCVAGFDGQLQQVNPAWTECLGWTAEELTSRPMLDFILPEDHEATRRIREKIYQGMPVRGFENRYRCKDGSYRWLSWAVYPLMASHQVFSVASDITERKQVLERLQEKEADLEEAQRIAKLGSWRHHLVSQQVLWSDELYRIFEIEPTEFEGTYEAFLDCVIPDDRPKVRRKIELAAAGGTSFQHEYRIQTRLGGWKHIREIGYARKAADGKVEGLFGTAQDITEQKRVEESLRLLNTAVLQARESVLITDAQLDLPGPRIVFVNPAFTEMTGYSAEEVIGKTPRILQGPRTDKSVLARLRKSLKRGEVFDGETTQYRKDGTAYEQEWRITPLRDDVGKITHYVAIQRDVSEHRKLEAQFRQSQKMEAFGQLAGGVAHDFNNILAVIQMQAGLLKLEPNLSMEQLEFAAEIEKAAGRAANLTRQLLLFSRKQTMQTRNLKLKDVVDNMTKMLQRTLGERIQLHFKFAEEAIVINADPGMIDQILLNLAVNAVTRVG